MHKEQAVILTWIRLIPGSGRGKFDTSLRGLLNFQDQLCEQLSFWELHTCSIITPLIHFWGSPSVLFVAVGDIFKMLSGISKWYSSWCLVFVFPIYERLKATPFTWRCQTAVSSGSSSHIPVRIADPISWSLRTGVNHNLVTCGTHW
jgi:hypothetical protein